MATNRKIEQRVCKHPDCEKSAWYRVTYSMMNGSQATMGARVQTWCKAHAIEEAERLNQKRRDDAS